MRTREAGGNLGHRLKRCEQTVVTTSCLFLLDTFNVRSHRSSLIWYYLIFNAAPEYSPEHYHKISLNSFDHTVPLRKSQSICFFSSHNANTSLSHPHCIQSRLPESQRFGSRLPILANIKMPFSRAQRSCSDSIVVLPAVWLCTSGVCSVR